MARVVLRRAAHKRTLPLRPRAASRLPRRIATRQDPGDSRNFIKSKASHDEVRTSAEVPGVWKSDGGRNNDRRRSVDGRWQAPARLSRLTLRGSICLSAVGGPGAGREDTKSANCCQGQNEKCGYSPQHFGALKPPSPSSPRNLRSQNTKGPRAVHPVRGPRQKVS